MTSRLSARLLSVTLLALLAGSALALLLRATPEGLALSDDSIAYIAGARSMLSGSGYREAWLASKGPVTHFPPAYPSVLAFLGWFGLDPLRGARFLAAVLFALNTALLGILGWRMTRLLPAGLLLAALFVLNDSLLRVHASALSEPLFIFLTLLSFWMFDLYCERDAHWLWLVACGSLVGMAYLTRYAGLALVATYVVALLVLNRTWRARATNVGNFLVSVAPWIGAWAVRNASLGESATNRVLVWHPITGSNLEMGLRTLSSFLMPIEPWRQALIRIPDLFLFLAVLILGGILAWLWLLIRRGLPAPGKSDSRVLPFLSALCIFGYLASIVAAMTLFDAATKFRLRILAPAYVCLLILAIALGVWAWSRRREVVIAGCVAVFAVSSFGQANALRELSKGGQGYASFRWYDSQAMAYLRELSGEKMIFTNEPGAVYLYTATPAYVLPDRIDPVTGADRPGFEDGIAELQAEVLAGRAVLALFSGGDTPAADAEALSRGLHLVHKSGGAEIYGAVP